ncbi:MAG: carboxypeptidase-like regulatory domain-containing protein [Chthoniobacterales bacterium]
MKSYPLLGFLLLVASAVYAIPRVEVTVSAAGGKVVDRGTTAADGTFATGKLSPGHYVVQFNSKDQTMKSDEYLLIVSAGKQSVISNALPGETFTTRGAAVKMDLPGAGKIGGQVASARALAQAKVRMINGKRYRWVESATGSNLGGHLAEATAGNGQQVQTLSTNEVNKLQEHAGEGSMINKMSRAEDPYGHH